MFQVTQVTKSGHGTLPAQSAHEMEQSRIASQMKPAHPHCYICSEKLLNDRCAKEVLANRRANNMGFGLMSGDAAGLGLAMPMLWRP